MRNLKISLHLNRKKLPMSLRKAVLKKSILDKLANEREHDQVSSSTRTSLELIRSQLNKFI